MTKAGLVFAVLAASMPAVFPGIATGGAGATGANLLKVSAGSRDLAMGSAETALVGDLAVILSNPALLSPLGRRSLHLMHWPGIADMRTEFLSYSLRAGALGVWAGTVLFRTFPAVDNEVPAEAPVEVNDGMLMMTIARPIGKGDGHVGMNVKLFNSTLGESKATSVAIDLGALGRPAGSEYLRYGASVTNVGNPIKHEAEGESLPVTVRGGMAYSRRIDPHHLTVALDVSVNVEQDARAAAGMEWMQGGRLGLRAGCAYRRFAPGGFSFPESFTFGAGWRFRSTMLGPDAEYNVDYAFLPFALLSQYVPTHAFSVFVKF